MSRVALDRNILIYAELEPDSAKGAERLTSYYEAPGTESSRCKCSESIRARRQTCRH
jgi:hypothetical protein